VGIVGNRVANFRKNGVGGGLQFGTGEYGRSILTRNDIENTDTLHCTSEEADPRVIRHAISISACTEQYYTIVAQTFDTYVFLILLATFRIIKSRCKSNLL
jgi:hypothetical protein